LLHYDGDDPICSNGGTSQVMELGGRWPQRLLFQHEVVRRNVAIIAGNDGYTWLCFTILIGFLQLLVVEFQ
jgi:hypothetical protein